LFDSGKSFKEDIVSLLQCGYGFFAWHTLEIVEKSIEAFPLDQVFPKISDLTVQDQSK